MSELQAFMRALESKESGGRNHPPNSAGASGYYQIIPGTWGGYGGYYHAYQAPRSVQTARARELISSYKRQFGTWWLTAVAWHAGPGGAAKAARNRSYAYGISDGFITTGKHADNIVGAMGQGGGGGGEGGQGMSPNFAAQQFAMQGAQGGGSFMGDLGFTRPMNTREAKEKAKELYGYLGWFVDHKEVGPILIKGAKEGWGPERLQGALVKTKWWKTTSEHARQWDALLTSDIATAKRRINETGLSIRAQANELGIWGMGHNRLFAITVAALRNGWNEQEVRLALASEMKWKPGTSTSERGVIGNIMRGVREQAADAMVPVTRKQEWEWARRIVAGQADPEAVKSQFMKLAKARFPHLSKEIDSGITPGQFFTPYRNMIANELEVSPDSIDLNSSKWRKVTSFKDSKMGKVRPMTMSEATLEARRTDDFTKTNKFQEEVAQTGSHLNATFGMR